MIVMGLLITQGLISTPWNNSEALKFANTCRLQGSRGTSISLQINLYVCKATHGFRYIKLNIFFLQGNTYIQRKTQQKQLWLALHLSERASCICGLLWFA